MSFESLGAQTRYSLQGEFSFLRRIPGNFVITAEINPDHDPVLSIAGGVGMSNLDAQSAQVTPIDLSFRTP